VCTATITAYISRLLQIFRLTLYSFGRITDLSELLDNYRQTSEAFVFGILKQMSVNVFVKYILLLL